MDHGKLRSRHPSKQPPIQIDFGNEPPLTTDGGSATFVDRRRISLRWFSGTILTGLCGAALMSGAVFVALDGQAYFATVPEHVEAALRGTIAGIADKLAAVAHKGDRLPTADETKSARQLVRISTTTRVGNREVIRVRPFVRVAANLLMTTSEISAHVPRFNPLKMLADSETAADNLTKASPASDAEVSFITRELPLALAKAKVAQVPAIEEIMASVRAAAGWTGTTGTVDLASLQPTMRLAYAAESKIDPYAGFETRIIPENVTLLPKTHDQIKGGNSWNETTVTVKKGDSIDSILKTLGATEDEIKRIVDAFGKRGKKGGLKEGQKVRVLLAPGADKRPMPIRVVIAGDTVEGMVALSDTGKYVAVDVRSAETTATETEETPDDGTGVRLYQSIWETALRQNIPKPVIDEIVRVYSYDVDFNRKVQPGDSFEVFYTGEDETSGEHVNQVLFTSLTIGGEEKKYYRFQSPDDGSVDYYDETGKSAKKFLVRKPVANAIMRSGFGWRRHPILGYSKMHTGVDWAAPSGTPIYAAGTGIIEKADWEAGYGKFVLIRHPNGYETAYGHMTTYARGIKEGVRVRQGQVIGYVGSTGLSTGPHCHFEIRINGRFVDPMRIKLPRGRELTGQTLAAFEAERERVNAMLQTPGQVAQTAAR